MRGGRADRRNLLRRDPQGRLVDVEPNAAPQAAAPTPSPEARLQRNVGNQALQRAIGEGSADARAALRAATAGLRGAATAVPHRDAIQRSFGRHSLAGVEAFEGDPATAAADALGAEAYCVGERLGFRRTPDLRTAAHEAAHAVQQRSGLALPGDRGHAGDPWERDADAVADRVVEGSSAEPLLDRYPAGNGDGACQLQLQVRDPTAERYEAQHPQFVPREYPQPEGAGSAAQGRYDVPGGVLTYAFAPRVGYVNARIEFVPDAELAQLAPTISFIQTVSSSIFNSRGESEVDVLPNETDPYYGARWDEAGQTWVDEPSSVQLRDPSFDDMTAPHEGSRPYTPATGSAVLNDSPMLNVDEVKYFETSIVIVDTGDVLGTLTWTVQQFEAGFAPAFLNRWLGWKQPTSTIVRNVSFTPGSSVALTALLDSYYTAHPEARRPADGSVPGRLR